MERWLANVMRKDGIEFTIGEPSEEELKETLQEMDEKGVAKIDESRIKIEVVDT